MRVPPTRSAWHCAPRARSTSPRRSSKPRACCSRWRRGRTRTSPTSRATSGPRSSRRCRPTTSSTRCRGGRARMPQHARRLKIRRKDLRKPDEFETLTGYAVAWAGEHRPVVYGVLAVAVVVLAGSLAIGRWRASRNDAAAVAFRSAQARFDEGKFQDAAQDFAYVVERSEEHTSELQSRLHLVCRLLLEKKKITTCAEHIRDNNDYPRDTIETDPAAGTQWERTGLTRPHAEAQSKTNQTRHPTARSTHTR